MISYISVTSNYLLTYCPFTQFSYTNYKYFLGMLQIHRAYEKAPTCSWTISECVHVWTSYHCTCKLRPFCAFRKLTIEKVAEMSTSSTTFSPLFSVKDFRAHLYFQISIKLGSNTLFFFPLKHITDSEITVILCTS